MTRRIFTACLGTETNSFSPIPTGMSVFQQTMLVRGGQHGDRPGLFGVPLLRWKQQAEALGWTVAEGLACFAAPAGNTTQATHTALRDEILADQQRALPVDAVLLTLHGAMIADGDPDAEGDLLARVRALVGPGVPIAAELDLHCHLTRQKVASADILVIYKHYPHVDVAERADEVFSLLHRMLDGAVRPVMAVYDCAMLGIYPTTAEPLAGMVERMTALESEPGVLSVSLAHGFPWGDTPEVGTRVLVVTDGDQALAERHATALGEAVWAARDAIVPPFYSIDGAIDRLLELAPDGRPVVLADTADNPGIGAAGLAASAPAAHARRAARRGCPPG
jgi:microcystin degradation protein MlrC